MRQSKLFTKTLKELPKDEVSINAKLLTQAGFIDKLSAGIYSYLPLGLKVLNKVKQIVREEMNAIDGQEILMPVLTPKEVWEKTGRWEEMGDVLFKLKSGGKEYALGSTHEEIVTPLLKKFITSYKDLPVYVYQIQDKFRNEARPKSGLLRGREFSMKDLYSFHTDLKDLDDYYEKSKQAYLNVFSRCGLDAKVVEASGGSFSKYSHEFQVVTKYGEDNIFYCSKCNRWQNKEIAEGTPNIPEGADEDKKKMEKVEAKREASIQASMDLMNIPAWKILKSIIYMTKDGLVGVSIRGDLAVNEVKLAVYLDDFNLRAATDEELEKAGLVVGFISPIKNDKVKFIGDLSVKTVNNFVTGANEKNQDYINANLDTDFNLSEFADLAEINENYKCVKCDTDLEIKKAIEVGNIFQLKNKFSDSFDLTYTDKDGKEKVAMMGCYGIGPSRIMGSVVEVYHDDQGMIWPEAVAPFMVHLIGIGAEKEADEIYKKLQEVGIEVLYDDRDISVGLKFADADLIGIPYRLVVSSKTQGKIEVKKRDQKDAELKDLEEVIDLLSKK